MSWPNQKYIKYPYFKTNNLKMLNGVNNDSISIGDGAGYNSQGTNAIAIGNGAGYNPQGKNSIALGYGAGFSGQNENTIIFKS